MTDQGRSLHAGAEDQRACWYSRIDLPRPYWHDYRALILHLQDMAPHGPELPDARQLQHILPDHAANQSGQAVKFVPSQALCGIDYEMHILQTGQISTRENNWHDLFNALVWARFPRLKSAINALHCREISQQSRAATRMPRGRLRDALTLLDESGAIVASADKDLLDRLSARDWRAVFRQHGTDWQEDTHMFICGHALLEKLLRPYKSLTAHALLLHLDAAVVDTCRENLLQMLDARLAAALLQGTLFASPAGLSPLPLMGIPGWWPGAEQDEAFYSDRQVFRRPNEGFSPAPVLSLSGFEGAEGDQPTLVG